MDVVFPVMSEKNPSAEGVVATWFVRDGEQVAVGQLIAEVQVDDAGLACHQPGHVRLGCQPQHVVQRGLAGTVVADRHFAHADQRIAEHDVAAHAAGQRAICRRPFCPARA